jgi:hypothetical protein
MNATAVAASSPVVSDTPTTQCVGLWHDTTDPLTGSGALNIITRNATTQTKTPLAVTTALAVNQCYDVYLYAPSGGTSIQYLIILYDTNTIVGAGTVTATIPTQTTQLAPTAVMSNGTANVVVTTTAIQVASIITWSEN